VVDRPVPHGIMAWAMIKTNLILKLLGQGKGVDSTGYIELLVRPVLRDKLLVI
jgi:hypothetical protein